MPRAASDAAAGSALEKHRIPVIDRMMDVLALLERRPGGLAIREMVEALDVPRTTVYRILNTLELHGMVRREAGGGYGLGPRLLSLAARVVGDPAGYDLAALALPHLERLSERTGEGSKLSVLDGGDAALVIAAVQGRADYALSAVPGQRLPLHAGAAGKLLLAHAAQAVLDGLISRPLARYTPRTLSEPAKLTAELARIRRQGWAEDRGEYSPSVRAFAAPVSDRAGRVVAALSVPFLAGADAARMERLRAAVIAAATAAAADLPAPPG